MNVASFLAQIGLVSRSQTSTFLKHWYIQINSQTIFSPVNLRHGDTILIGNQIYHYQDHYTILLYKPQGYVCSEKDEWWFVSYKQLLQNYPYHRLVSCAGRLDGNSHGLILCTSDGQLIHRITHPKSKLPKTYHVQVKFPLSDADIDQLRHGVVLDDGTPTLPAQIHYLGDDHKKVSLTIVEGKFHQIKRMMIAVHNQVTDLCRVSIGPRNLENLLPGQYQEI